MQTEAMCRREGWGGLRAGQIVLGEISDLMRTVQLNSVGTRGAKKKLTESLLSSQINYLLTSLTIYFTVLSLVLTA